jgi:hypothetical protein
VIKTANPTPSVSEFRLQFNSESRRARRILERRRHTSVSSAQDMQQTYNALRDSIAAYRELEPRFEDIVNLFCIAAHEGVTIEREAEFRTHRAWFLKHYSGFQSYLQDYLVADASDRAPGWWRLRPCDAFEALFLPRTLTAALESDNGHLIHRLTRTQNAMLAWQDALRRHVKI